MDFFASCALDESRPSIGKVKVSNQRYSFQRNVPSASHLLFHTKSTDMYLQSNRINVAMAYNVHKSERRGLD